MNTCVKSTTKSRKSQGKSELSNLVYSPDFREFYRLNEKAIVKIVEYCVRRRYVDDPSILQEDLFNQVILSLQESGFLKNYNPSLMSLNSYLTRRVNIYLNRIYSKCHERAKLFKSHYGVQYMFSELNCIDPPESGNTGPSVRDNTESRAICNDLIRRLMSNLSERHQIVLRMLIKENTREDIAKVLDKTEAFISALYKELSDKAQKIWGK